ncbi:glutathione S-transferase family protein [Sulfitobacter mediterraneus]|uniref:Glutathione S-transferase n=1 Tax=Sulfitobacter mediterraneus TaxID=83219 RepID=A0A061STX5_9RHOB|nr:glutathione S-transferase family protein [Sulfitobacter mediterraneus]KAJ04377.1 glutathione S-transferase [Sulfitobacter mediterraneus]
MAEPLNLLGFRHSVYTRIARMGLIETGLTATYVEANPFAAEPDPVLAAMTPLGRVPVLLHGDFVLTETAAILRYLNDLGPKASLIPTDPQSAARMAQVMGIVDAYVYQPLVRKVFSHGFYQAAVGEDGDSAIVAEGLVLSQAPLRALDSIAAGGLQLGGARISLADLHLAPMMDYFVRVPEAADLLRHYPALSAWWHEISNHPSLRDTDPFPDQ